MRDGIWHLLSTAYYLLVLIFTKFLLQLTNTHQYYFSNINEYESGKEYYSYYSIKKTMHTFTHKHSSEAQNPNCTQSESDHFLQLNGKSLI